MRLMGIPGHTVYAATKAALRSYACTWAAEFKGRSIRVNTLSQVLVAVSSRVVYRAGKTGMITLAKRGEFIPYLAGR